MKKENRPTVRWLYETPGKKRGYIGILVIVQVLLGATGVFYALLLKNIIDAAVNQNRPFFWLSVIEIVVLLLIQQSLQAAVRWLNEMIRATYENLFKRRLTDQIMRKDYSRVNMIHSGEWMNRITNDTVVVTNGYVDILPGIAGTVVRLVSAFTMLTILQGRIILFILPGALLLYLITSVMRNKLKKLHKEVQNSDGKVRAYLQEHIASMMMIRSFVAEKRSVQGAYTLMQDHKALRMKKNCYSNVLNTVFASAMEGIYLFGACYCAYGILSGTMSYGILAAVTQLIGQIRAPFAYISGYLPKYYAMLASAERLMEVEQFDDDLAGTSLTREEISDFYSYQLEGVGLHHAEYTYYPANSEIEGMRKDHMPVVLHDLTVEIRKGEYVAFTGHSGCGKSTVLKLLMSMYPLDGGTRTLLCRDGKVIPLTAAYRRLFAYVPQGNQLMTGTIREIVSFAEEGEADEQKIDQALWIACANEFVDELQDGIDTQLGERGAGLSEGQMQRIAIARALYSDAPVLLLDEATSALDAATEEKLLFNLREMTDKTVVIVTHRQAALEICDRVLEFMEGGVEER